VVLRFLCDSVVVCEVWRHSLHACGTLIPDQVYERSVYAGVVRQFGVERRGHDFSLPDGDGIVAFSGKDFYVLADVLDPGRADENHFGGLAAEFAFANRAVNLATVGIAADADVEHTQSFLLRILDFVGEEDSASAGTERGFHAHELFQLFESGFAEQFQKRARFTAGDHQAVDFVELLGLPDEHNFSTQLLEPFAVRVKVALQCKNADGHFGRSSLVVRRSQNPRLEIPGSCASSAP
jgi:hypothetical protein